MGARVGGVGSLFAKSKEGDGGRGGAGGFTVV